MLESHTKAPGLGTSLIAVFLCAILAVPLQAETIWWEDNADFHEDFVDDVCTLTDVEAGADVDYIFLAAQQGVNLFTVDPDELLEIDFGVTIWLDQDVELIIEGQMTNTGDGNGQIAFGRRIVNEVERGAWRCIRINDLDADPDPNEVGNITLENASFHGGGAGADPAIGECDWRGLIVIQSLVGSNPVLDLTDCVLGYSLHNGIVAKSIGDVETATITLLDCQIGNTAIENIIQDNGIKLGDENETEPWMQGQPAEMDLRVFFTATGTHSFNCGKSGFYCFDGGGEYRFVGCNFSHNGLNDDVEAEGNGIYFRNHNIGAQGAYGEDGNYPGPETLIDIGTTLVEENNRDGIRLKESEATVIIHADTSFSNGQRGVYYDFSCHSGLGRVEYNEVKENGWDGIAAFKGHDFQVAIWILDNDVEDNVSAVLPDGEGEPWENSVERCASIRLHGNFGGSERLIRDANAARLPAWTTIANNFIVGGNSGISIEDLDAGENEGHEDPSAVDVHNNIQMNALFAGLRLEDYDEAGDLAWNGNWDCGPVFYNNVFYNNGPVGEIGAGDGIWLGEDTPDNDVLLSNRFQGNLIVDNAEFGIINQNLMINPFFFNNGLFNNDADFQLCSSSGVFADPPCVDPANGDFHLRWDSPMINRGSLGMDIWDPDPNVDRRRDFADTVYPTEEDISRDGSNNDIGPYGGFAAADFGFDPYCAIPSGADVINDNLPANRDWLENDYYRIFGNITTSNGEALDVGNPAAQTAEAYFEFADDDLRWTIYGTFNVYGDPDNGAPKTVHFTNLDPADAFDRIYFVQPDATCRFYGCVFKGADDALYYQGSTAANGIELLISNCAVTDCATDGLFLYNMSGNVTIANTTVENCGRYGIDLWNTGGTRRTCNLSDITITDCDSRGLSILDNVQAICQDIEVSDCIKQGVYLNGSYDVGAGTQSVLERVDVTHCNTSGASTSEAGIYVYESNPRITQCFVHDNFDYGIYITNTSDPAIDGVDEDHVNNILNNGDPGNQTNTLGAEIRLADNNSMEGAGVIDYINVYDIREDERDGKIASKSGSNALNINHFYFGNGRAANWVAGDLYASSNPWTTSNDNGNTAFDPDEWANVDSDEEDPEPANTFEEGIAAMKAGEFALAVSKLWEWIGEEPSSHSAASAVHSILRSEQARGANLATLRTTFLSLADTSDSYPELAWMARRMAVKCQIYNGEREDAKTEYESMRAFAPSIIDSLFLELDILFVEEDISGDHIDAIFNREANLTDRIEELLAAGEVQGVQKALPTDFELTSAYPNPFNGSTRLSFSMPRASKATLAVYGIDGRLVETLVNGSVDAGRHSVAWNGLNHPAGMYVLRMDVGSYTTARRLVLVK